jgi:hypothetical protein
MEKEVILLVTGALISLASSLMTSVFNYRLSRRQWQEQQQHDAQNELRRSLSVSLEDIHRHGLGPLRGHYDTNESGTILPSAVGQLEIDTGGLIDAVNKIDTPSITVEYLLHLVLEIDKTNN